MRAVVVPMWLVASLNAALYLPSYYYVLNHFASRSLAKHLDVRTSVRTSWRWLGDIAVMLEDDCNFMVIGKMFLGRTPFAFSFTQYLYYHCPLSFCPHIMEWLVYGIVGCSMHSTCLKSWNQLEVVITCGLQLHWHCKKFRLYKRM